MKHIIFLYGTICLTTGIYGQSNKYDIGGEGGASIVYLRSNTALNSSDFGIGFSGGLAFQYNLPKIFSLRTGAAFERKGSAPQVFVTDVNGSTIGKARQHLNFNYLTVPILLRATFGKKTTFFMDAGGFFGYLIDAKEIFKDASKPSLLHTTDLTTGVRRIDAGIALGVGIGIPIKNKILLSFEFINSTGLYNIQKNSFHNSFLKTRSDNLLIGITYKFGARNS